MKQADMQLNDFQDHNLASTMEADSSRNTAWEDRYH